MGNRRYGLGAMVGRMATSTETTAGMLHQMVEYNLNHVV